VINVANTIDPTSYLSNYQKQTPKTGNSALGKDDFLKILITQLRNQDPTSPMEDKDFIAQMATFSTLEQITNMSKSFDKFAEQQDQIALIQYQQFIGSEIAYEKVTKNDDGTTNKTKGTGVIEGIQYTSSGVVFQLMNGEQISGNDITQINEKADESYMMQASQLIGKTVTWKDSANEEHTAVVGSVSFQGGKASFHINDGANTTFTAAQIIKISG